MSFIYRFLEREGIHHTEMCDLKDREFKTAILEKHNKLQENTDRQFNKLRNQINKQHEYFTKEIVIFKNQIKILEIKNSIKEIKKELANIGNRADRWRKELVITR